MWFKKKVKFYERNNTYRNVIEIAKKKLKQGLPILICKLQIKIGNFYLYKILLYQRFKKKGSNDWIHANRGVNATFTRSWVPLDFINPGEKMQYTHKLEYFNFRKPIFDKIKLLMIFTSFTAVFLSWQF